MATHSSILAWRIPWTEERGRLQSMWLQESDMTWQLKREITVKGQIQVLTSRFLTCNFFFPPLPSRPLFYSSCSRLCLMIIIPVINHVLALSVEWLLIFTPFVLILPDLAQIQPFKNVPNEHNFPWVSHCNPISVTRKSFCLHPNLLLRVYYLCSY